VPKPVGSSALPEVSRVLETLSETVASVEDDLLSCLVVMGEPRAQRTVDAWVDQVVDLVRAVDEVTSQHLATLARVTARVDSSAGDEQPLGQGSLETSASQNEQR